MRRRTAGSMEEPAHLRVDIDHERREIEISGELDYASRSSVTDSTAELNEDGPGDIDLDLDGVTFIDAAGVGAVVAADNEQVRRDTALNVRSRSQVVRRMFQLCGLSRLLDRVKR